MFGFSLLVAVSISVWAILVQLDRDTRQHYAKRSNLKYDFELWRSCSKCKKSPLKLYKKYISAL